MLKTKVCPRSTVQVVNSLPPPPPLSALPPIASPLPKKKSVPSHPFINGVVGKVYFSLTPVHHYFSIPIGKSIIICNFQKALPHEKAESSSYVLMDTFDGLWLAPEVFDKWCKAVESGAISELDMSTNRLSLACIGSEFRLYVSLKRNSYKDLTQPAPAPYAPLCAAVSNKEEEEEETLSQLILRMNAKRKTLIIPQNNINSFRY